MGHFGAIFGLAPLFGPFPKSKYIFDDIFEISENFLSKNGIVFKILTISLRVMNFQSFNSVKSSFHNGHRFNITKNHNSKTDQDFFMWFAAFCF